MDGPEFKNELGQAGTQTCRKISYSHSSTTEQDLVMISVEKDRHPAMESLKLEGKQKTTMGTGLGTRTHCCAASNYSSEASSTSSVGVVFCARSSASALLLGNWYVAVEPATFTPARKYWFPYWWNTRA